jgi:hypothetical protein
VTIDIEQFRAELRHDARRFTLLAVAGALASVGTGMGLVGLAAYLGGRFCR